jgi:uridine phosphorylase
VISCSEKLRKIIKAIKCLKGVGSSWRIYGPGVAMLRLNIQDEELNSKMDNFEFEKKINYQSK